jgi:hypothetical protein
MDRLWSSNWVRSCSHSGPCKFRWCTVLFFAHQIQFCNFSVWGLRLPLFPVQQIQFCSFFFLWSLQKMEDKTKDEPCIWRQTAWKTHLGVVAKKKGKLHDIERKASVLAALDYYISMHSDIFISSSPGNMHNALVSSHWLKLSLKNPNLSAQEDENVFSVPILHL